MRDRKNYHSFLIYTENGEAVQELSDADAGALLKDMFRFVYSGCQAEASPLLPDTVRPIAALMRSQISRDKVKYDEECEKKQEAINKRWEAERKRREAGQDKAAKDSRKYKSIDKNTSVYTSKKVNTEDEDEVEVEDEVVDEDEAVVDDESNSTPNGVHDRHKNNKAAEPPREGIFLADYVLSAWQEFVSMRKRIRKPLTGNAESRIRKKLEKLSGGDSIKAEAILLQSVDNCWQDIFELREGRQDSARGNGHKPLDWSNI